MKCESCVVSGQCRLKTYCDAFLEGRNDGISNTVNQNQTDPPYWIGVMEGERIYQLFISSTSDHPPNMKVKPFTSSVETIGFADHPGHPLYLKKPDLSGLDGSTFYKDDHALH